MEVDIKKDITITLKLTLEEARWLNAVMQNPLHDKHPFEEDPNDAAMRHKFFDATKAQWQV